MFATQIALFIIVAIFILALTCPKWVKSNVHWINKDWIRPVVNFLFVISVRKVTLAYFSVFASLLCFNPLAKLLFRVEWGSEQGVWLQLGYAPDWIDIGSIVPAFLLTIGYALYIVHELKALKVPSDEQLQRIEDSTQRSEQILNSVSARISSKAIVEIIPELKKAISELKVKTAKGILDKLIDHCLEEACLDYTSLMYLEYHRGLCLLYADRKAAYVCFEKARKYMDKAGRFDSDIVAENIKIQCVRTNMETAQRLIEQLRVRQPNHIAIAIFEVYSSQDCKKTFDSIPKTERPLLLAHLMTLDANRFDLPLLDEESYECMPLITLTLENIPLWVLNMSVALTKFLKDWVYMPKSKNMEETEESERLYQITDACLEHLRETELPKIIPDLEFIHALASYIHDRSPKWIDRIKQFTYHPKSKELYHIAVASMMVSENKIEDAVTFLGTYGEEVTAAVINYRLYLAIQMGDKSIMKEIFMQAVSDNVEFDGVTLNNILTAILFSNEDFRDFVPRLNVKDDLSKRLLQEVTNFYAGDQVDVDYIKQHIDNIPMVFIPHVSRIYEEHVGTDEAIALVEPIIDYSVYDIRTHVYFNLLRKDRKFGSKLYDFCEKLRANGISTTETLNAELNLAEKSDDYERVLKITDKMLNEDVMIGELVEHHLLALRRIHNKQAIADFYPRLKNYTYTNPGTITNIFNVYLDNDMPERALEYLYQQVVNCQSQEMRDLYYQVCVGRELADIVHKQEGNISIGSYVLIERDGLEEYVEVTKGSIYESLVGKCIDEEEEIKLPFSTLHIIVRGIFNKYHKLCIEIQKDIQANKSAHIRSFSIEDLRQGDGILANMAKLAGENQEGEDALKEAVEKYKRGEVTLYALLPSDTPVADLYNKLFGTFSICMLPRELVVNVTEDSAERTQTLQPILDLSGLLMMQELSERFHLSFKQKFVLPRSVDYMIDDAVTSEMHGFPSFLMKDAVSNLTINLDECKPNLTLLGLKLSKLKAWIKEWCDVQANEDILNRDVSMVSGAIMRQFIDASMMAMSKQYILISEDWVLSRLTTSNPFVMSSSNWLSVVMPELTGDLDDYFFELHYLGCHLSSDMLYRLLVADDKVKRTLLPVTLENIAHFNKCVPAILEVSLNLTQGIMPPGTFNYIYLLMKSMFEGMEYLAAQRLKSLALSRSKSASYRAAVEEAFRTTHPVII